MASTPNAHSSTHAFDVSAAARLHRHRGCGGWRSGRSTRTQAWCGDLQKNVRFFTPNKGRVRTAPHRPVRSSRTAVLDTSCQKKESGGRWAGGRTPSDGRRSSIYVLFTRGMLVSAVRRMAPGILSTCSEINCARGAQTVCMLRHWPALSAPHARTCVY